MVLHVAGEKFRYGMPSHRRASSVRQDVSGNAIDILDQYSIEHQSKVSIKASTKNCRDDRPLPGERTNLLPTIAAGYQSHEASAISCSFFDIWPFYLLEFLFTM